MNEKRLALFGFFIKALVGLLDAKGVITTDELIEASAKEAGISVEEWAKLVKEALVKEAKEKN